MDDEFAKPRDVDNDLAEITSRLGEPEAVYRTNMRGVAWRFALGVLLLVAAAGSLVAVLTGQWRWAKNFIHVGLFVCPIAGLYLIYFAVSGLKLWVLEYPSGLFVWHRGKVVAFPWDDIVAMQLSVIPENKALVRTDGTEGLPATVWYDLERSRRQGYGIWIKLTRADGEQVSLTSTLDGFFQLSRRVQEETSRRMFPARWSELLNGATVSFGAIQCSGRGIVFRTKVLPWRELDSVMRDADKLVMRSTKKKRAWAKCEPKEIINLHVLMEITAAARLALGPDGTQR